MNEKSKRFTVTLPGNIHAELVNMASKKGISSKDVILKSLKLGLIALEIDDDRSKELILRENLEGEKVKETRLILL